MNDIERFEHLQTTIKLRATAICLSSDELANVLIDIDNTGSLLRSIRKQR